MTTNIEFDAVSNSWDEHTSAAENHISTGVRVAQATTGQAASEVASSSPGDSSAVGNLSIRQPSICVETCYYTLVVINYQRASE